MRFVKYVPILLALLHACPAAAAQPVLFQGDSVTIVHDGSQIVYDPHTQLGKAAIRDTRGVCCVEAPEHWHGQSEAFAFGGDPNQHMQHQSSRFVINPHSGAFVSSTTLEDPRYPATDPRHYVDSDTTPMVSLSTEQIAACGCKPGDRVLISDAAHEDNHVWAVYGNNAGDQAEGLGFTGISIAAATALRIPLDPLTHDTKDIAVKLKLAVYPGSGYGNHFPHGALPPVNDKELR